MATAFTQHIWLTARNKKIRRFKIISSHIWKSFTLFLFLILEYTAQLVQGMNMCVPVFFKHLGLVSNLVPSLKHPIMIHTDSPQGKKGCCIDVKHVRYSLGLPCYTAVPLEASRNSRNKRRKTVRSDKGNHEWDFRRIQLSGRTLWNYTTHWAIKENHTNECEKWLDNFMVGVGIACTV